MQPESRSPGAHRPFLAEGWQGTFFIAATYVYFLIFAQFGFLKRLAELGMTEASLPVIMGSMAFAGIGMSLVAPRIRLWNCPDCRLQTGFIGCGLTALWSLFPLNLYTACGVAFVIGLSLGLLTVTLVANLPHWLGADRALFKIGLGTGAAYFVCNFPPLFNARPVWIALTSACCCITALIVAVRKPLGYVAPASIPGPEFKPVSFPLVLAWFTALVWLDSAAFFIIQNSPVLKVGAWQGDLHLWRTGILHFAAALLSAWLLSRRGLMLTLTLALAALGGACLFLLDPLRSAAAAFLYPAGVSLYSVALVAYPSFLMASVSPAVRARRAGYLYAVAGWIGSAMGIGMGRNLHHVPVAFVGLAAALFVAPWLWNAIASGRFGKSAQIEALAVVGMLAVAFAVTLVVRPTIRPFANVPEENAIERGRRVYIAEGCINCHSQYVRPHTADVAMWGPATDLDAVRRQQPPLIGNRRQGPDLSQVGARRSPLWLRMHFVEPRDVSFQSPMPEYGYLFRNRRGDDLIAYLSSLNDPRHWEGAAQWRPDAEAWQNAARDDGSALFKQHCATCHASGGAARTKWAGSFRRLPSDLAGDPLKHVSAEDGSVEARVEIARMAKFGIQGTEMPGHEYLRDDQIAAIANYVAEQRELRERAHRK